MKVAITGDDGFIAPHLATALKDRCIMVDDEVLSESRMLDAALASCTALVHMNGHPPGMNKERDDREALNLMREDARRINEAVERHQGLHLILIGSLRVHPNDDYLPYSSDSSIVPRDVTAEGQLWSEERALEHASPTHPVTIIRTANVHGTPLNGDPPRGIINRLVEQAESGWILVPGDENKVKDLIHVTDLVKAVEQILSDPPPTRETLVVGRGEPVMMNQLAEAIADSTSSLPSYGADDENEVWGIIDGPELESRLGFLPNLGWIEILDEALNR